MNLNKRILFILLIVSSIYGCDEIFEKDISEEPVNLLAPSNNILTTNQSITFWWDSINGATDYNLQVVSETFETIEYLAIDSILDYSKCTKELPVGKYQWRVKAYNSISETTSETWNFEITEESGE